MNRMTKIAIVPAVALTMLAGGAVAGYARLAGAATQSVTTKMGNWFKDAKPHVGGEITAINGTTLTIQGFSRDGMKNGMRNDAQKNAGQNSTQKNETTYTIDASQATFEKNGTAATLSTFAVGDRVMIEGTLNGTSVVATKIFGGMPMMKVGPGGMGHEGMGRGVQGVMGKVTAVSGTTLTVQREDGTVYTVDTTDATFNKVVNATLSDIVVGDTIGAHGPVTGTTVKATHIMDDVNMLKKIQQ